MKRAISLVLVWLLACSYPASASTLKPGIDYRQLTVKDGRGQDCTVHVVEADLNHPWVETRVVMAQDKLGSLEKVEDMAARSKAQAAINGGFFTQGKKFLPTDTVMINGRLVTKGNKDPAAFGITWEGQAFVDVFTPKIMLTLCRSFRQFEVEAINHECGMGLILYTSAYGSATGTPASSLEFVVVPDGENEKRYRVASIHKGNAPIPEKGYVLSFQGVTSNLAQELKIGDEVSVDTYFPEGRETIRDLLACGPLLVKNGIAEKPDLTFLESKLRSRHPRSALGVKKGNRLLLVMTEGRQKERSQGLTYEELARLMVQLGVQEAVALDGGDSSSLYWDGTTLVGSGSQRARKVADAVVVISQMPVYIDGRRVYFSTPPAVVNGRAMVPLRELLEYLGCTVEWDAAMRTIKAFNGVSELVIALDKSEVWLNGTLTPMEVLPVVVKGRTLVSLRVISNFLGAQVQWDPQRQAVYITTR